MIEGAVRPAAHVAARRAAGLDPVAPAAGMAERRGGAGVLRRRSGTVCAGRNSTPPGATNSPNGATPRRPSTCCNSACGWAQRPRQLITTTPRPIPLIKRLIADPRTRGDARARRSANAAHLSPAFSTRWSARYAGTRLGRQEIDGEIIEERADALWSRALIEACARRAARRRSRASSSAIDPPARRRPGADACGIVAAGMRRETALSMCWRTRPSRAWRRPAGRRRRSRCIGGSRPTRWSPRSTGRRHGARGAARRSMPRCRCRSVHATRGKWLRAEPVAAMYAARQGQACRSAAAGARGRDVRLRPERPVIGRFAGPARRAGLGGDRARRARPGAGAAGANALNASRDGAFRQDLFGERDHSSGLARRRKQVEKLRGDVKNSHAITIKRGRRSSLGAENDC